MPFGYTHTLKKISKFPLRYQLPPLWIFKRLCLIGSKGNPKFLWFAFFFFKCFWPPHGIWGSQARNQILASHELNHSCGNTGSLTHCARSGPSVLKILPIPLCHRESFCSFFFFKWNLWYFQLNF